MFWFISFIILCLLFVCIGVSVLVDDLDIYLGLLVNLVIYNFNVFFIMDMLGSMISIDNIG